MQSMITNNNPVRLHIITTNLCNNNCLFCGYKRFESDISSDEIKKTIIDSQDKILNGNVVFAGGEPTLRKDLPDLISFVRKIGLNATLFTNARRFENLSFTQMIKKSGLNRVLVPINGHNPEIHDKITQRKGSFIQSITGIHNLNKLGIGVMLKTIPNKINYKYLVEIIDFICSEFPFTLGIGMDTLAVLDSALLNGKIIVPKISDYSKYLELAVDVADKYGKFLNISNVPLCLLRRKYWKYVTKSRHTKFLEKKVGKVRTLTLNASTPICKNCSAYNICPGAWQSYFDYMGFDELKPINLNNNYIN